MIWQSSVFDWLFQAAVLLQPLFWMWLYDVEIRLPEKLKYIFYIIGAYALLIVNVIGFEVGYYKTSLLTQYIVFTLIATLIYNTRYSFKQALSLAFLTTFLNSFYWEAPLHIAAWLSGESIANILLQVWRLIPLAFFNKRYVFKWSQRLPIELGFIYSTITMFAALYIVPDLRTPLYAINRVICLIILIKTITESKVKQS